MTFLTTLNYPDFQHPFDQLMLTGSTVMIIIALFANGRKTRIPFFDRKGGLMTYSKFAADNSFGFQVPSRLGMLLLYAPALLSNILYCFLCETSLAAILSIIHFGKRTIECLFLHRYSGSMPLASGLFIGLCIYLPISLSSCYHGSQNDNTENNNTKYYAVLLFGVGIAGNLYHHYLLATLRTPSEMTPYKIPQGGLFRFVAAPHYFFEIICWTSMSILSQHLITFSVCVAMSLYLADRARGQSEWYRNHNHLKEKYPDNRKHIVPFIY
jgi:very-long-chain enoyl-CoA reductase